MKETQISAIITIIIILAFSGFQASDTSNMFDATGGMGLACFWLGLSAAIIGLVLSIIPITRKYGQGILIGGGILMLIGFSLCTGGFGLIK